MNKITTNVPGRYQAMWLVNGGLVGRFAFQITDRQPRPVHHCGTVAFAPNSSYGAFSIKARGVGCSRARRVAAGSHARRYGPGGTSC